MGNEVGASTRAGTGSGVVFDTGGSDSWSGVNSNSGPGFGSRASCESRRELGLAARNGSGSGSGSGSDLDPGSNTGLDCGIGANLVAGTNSGSGSSSVFIIASVCDARSDLRLSSSSDPGLDFSEVPSTLVGSSSSDIRPASVRFPSEPLIPLIGSSRVLSRAA